MNWHVDISGTIALRGLFVDGGAEAAVKAYLSNFVAGHGGNNYVVSMAANSNVTMSRCAVTQLFASGTGVIQTAGSSFTALRSIFDVPAAAGYAVKGAGTFIYASDVFLQSANVQNTLSLTAPRTRPFADAQVADALKSALFKRLARRDELRLRPCALLACRDEPRPQHRRLVQRHDARRPQPWSAARCRAELS